MTLPVLPLARGGAGGGGVKICSFNLKNGYNAPSMKTELTVQAIGEQGLLALLQAFCPAEVIGDDAAVLALAPEQSLVVTTDLLVENVHFSEQTTSAEDVGWRAAAANLSDLAAMGASPVGITVGLGLPGHLPVAWILSLYQGLQACLAPWQTPILGGIFAGRPRSPWRLRPWARCLRNRPLNAQRPGREI